MFRVLTNWQSDLPIVDEFNLHRTIGILDGGIELGRRRHVEIVNPGDKVARP